MKIYQEAHRDIEQAHMTQQLGDVDWKNRLDRLGFNDEATVDQKIHPQRFIEYIPLVGDRNDQFTNSGDMTQLKFTCEAL